jgi:N-acyl-D-aspartate/D-glutamate deacylase
MRLAKQYDVPVFFHARYSDMEEPGTNFEALNELIGYAKQTGASVHIDHINSTGGTFSMKQSLKMIDEARAAGLDITACMYPYNFWGTYLNSARFDKGWQQRFHISYGDLQLAGTTERLTEQTFGKYQRQGKLAVAYAIPEEDVEEALRSPFVMIGSDAILGSGYNNHPRASGAFSRTIGRYVRDKKTISLMDAVAKMTILPAQRLERRAGAMKKKGRISVGADADIVVFDLTTIIDKSTVEHPEHQSTGVAYVIVAGKIVKDLTGLKKNVRAGKPIKNDYAR